jgi:phthalate 4,5-dioxygenase oxygenase subunit
MLSREDNELLTRVGPGTPIGELFRRFWLPALLPHELPTPDCDPVRLRLMGEDLVAIRDTHGRLGVFAENCPHRGASLFFGRNEEGGLRCVYHGWKFAVDGRCLEMPNEPAESDFKHKVRATAYPAAEWGGLVWVYMGPPELKPELPQIEWCLLPDSHRYLGKWIQEANYMQGFEGAVDSSHVSFLHAVADPTHAPHNVASAHHLWIQDKAPRLSVQETDYGYVYGSRRTTTNGNYYWRLTQWLLPTFTLVPTPVWPMTGVAFIPMDDENTWIFGYGWHPDRPLSEAERAQFDAGLSTTPKVIPGTFRPVVNRDNGYMLDRARQRAGDFMGVPGVQNQDRAIVESMGPILDRRKERLGTSDVAVIAARRILLRLARQLRDGHEPMAQSDGSIFRVRPFDAILPEPDFQRVLEAHKQALVSPVAPLPQPNGVATGEPAAAR